jgi:universal stress protein A
MKKIKRILVPTDFSELSIAAVEYAKTFARRFRARVYLVHVVESVPILYSENLTVPFDILSHDARKSATKKLKELAKRKFKATPRLKLLVREGHLPSELIMVVQDEQIDLIVMATHGRTGLPHTLIGSVAEDIVRHSPVPVLTVRPEPMRQPELEAKVRE